MKKEIMAVAGIAMAVTVVLVGCEKSGEAAQKEVELDPSNPVSLTIWHYYNGAQQAAFDQLVEEFNATEGSEKGIYVEGYSQGSVSDLEEAVRNSIEGVVGAEELPDLFSSYADTAYSARKKEKLVDLSEYFTEEELVQYVESYIEEGYFQDEDALYLFPTAKSTEIFMMNRTDWEPFAEATGTTLEELATTEGVAAVSKRYYEWTDSLTPEIPDDGKAFYGRDAMSNYLIIGMKQMGVDLLDVTEGKVTIRAEKDKIKRLWDNYYIPYINGYFASYGRFRSDDVKTGDILAYTGSSSSATYFPDRVESEGETYEIDYIAAPAPLMEGGENVRVQQGAGMAVTKSNRQKEYAACEFLRWFTEKENNIRFVCESAYLPVLKEANDPAALDAVIEETQIQMNEKAYDCLVTVLENFEETTYYTTKNFTNGYSVRNVLTTSLQERATADREAIEEAMAAGKSRSEAVAEYTTEEVFDEWYEDFVAALEAAANQG